MMYNVRKWKESGNLLFFFTDNIKIYRFIDWKQKLDLNSSQNKNQNYLTVLVISLYVLILFQIVIIPSC